MTFVPADVRAGRDGAADGPPAGLPGLDPAWSRFVRAPSSDGEERAWHVLDTGPLLAEAGILPVGTILAVHGNPTWAYTWRSVLAASLQRTAEVWRVVAVDQLEMGWSERTGRTRRLADRVADLGLLTDALELAGPVVTLGHDWGGIVSLGWAVDHPELLAAVILLNTGVHQPDERPPGPLRLALAPGVTRPATVTTPGFLETTLAIAHPPLDGAVRDAYRAPYRTPARRRGIGTFVEDIALAAEHPSRPELDRIAAGAAGLTVPALLLWGPRDPVFGEAHLADLQARLPHADLHRFEGAGHLVVEDADVAGTVLAWLDARAATPEVLPGDSAPFRPLWDALDRRAGDPSLALAELGGSRRRVSWRMLARRVTELAAGLRAAGLRPGDRVSLLVPPGADLTAALYGCLRAGAVVVVADAGLGLAGLTRAVRGARPDWVVGVPAALAAARALGWPGQRISAPTLPTAAARALGVRHSLASLARLGRGAEPPEPPGPEDLAAVLFTSGSTGPAKGVRYTHRRLAGVRDALRDAYGLDEGAGWVAGFAPFALLGPAFGCRTATPDMDVTHPGTLTAARLGDAVAAIDADTVFLSPAALANVVATAAVAPPEARTAFERVHVLLSAGAPVGLPLLDRAAPLFPGATVHTPYGMTECLLVTDVALETVRDTAESGGTAGGVCVGTPIRVVRVRIAPLDADGRATGAPTAAPGTTGEVLIDAPHMLEGYDRLWRTDAAARLVLGGERWHRTGDVGHLDELGRLWIEGRLPHVVVTADGLVTPVGAEQRVESVPAVRRAAVVGVGPRGTQQVVVVVETEPAVRGPRLAAAELAAAVRGAAGMPVAAVLAVPRLPTDIRHNSKIDRARLAAWAGGILAGGRMRRP